MDYKSFSEARKRSEEMKREADREAAKVAAEKRAAKAKKNSSDNGPPPGMRWDMFKARFVPDLGDPVKTLLTETPKPVLSKSALELDAKIKLVAKGNPRAEGTGAFKRYNEMMKFLNKHPDATVGDVLSKTSYRKDDYLWDLKKGNIK